MNSKKELESLAQFIRDHRSKESNFQPLYEKLVAAYKAAQNGNPESEYLKNLRETLEKHAATYKSANEKGISSWPEFENFVKHFETSVTAALHD